MTIRKTAKYGTGFWCDDCQTWVLPITVNTKGFVELQCPSCFLEDIETWAGAKIVAERTAFPCPRLNCLRKCESQEDLDTHIKYAHDYNPSRLCDEKTCVVQCGSNCCQFCGRKCCFQHMEQVGNWGVCKQCAAAKAEDDPRRQTDEMFGHFHGE